jgi:hypothetical protein
MEPLVNRTSAAGGVPYRVAYPMAEKHKPKKGPHHGWVYPRSADVLQECGINTITHYIDVWRTTILRYVVNQPIYGACRASERKRGSHHDSGGGNGRCPWMTKMQTEPMFNCTLVGSSDDIQMNLPKRWQRFYREMWGEHLVSSQGVALPPPCGGCATTRVYLFHTGGKFGGWKLWDTKV